MIFSVSNAFERKRKELYKLSHSDTSFISEDTLYHSKQLDHFVNLYQNQKRSELHLAENIDGSKLTIKIKGQLDLITSEELTTFFESRKNKWTHLKELYIDLIDLHFFDTSGLRSVIVLLDEARKLNISIKTIFTNQTTYEVLTIMGLPKALKKINYGTFIAV